MQRYMQIVCVTLAFAGSLLLQEAHAQRSPYAGSRPPNGLSQKDKYTTNMRNGGQAANTAATTSAPINSLAYGQPQRPPVGSYVMPEPTYTALSNPAATRPEFSLGSRFGEDSSSVVNRIGGTAASAARPSTPLPMPLDAHGDRELIERLSRLPEDQRPFWFVNYLAIEAHRNGTNTGYAGPATSSGSFFG